MTFHELVLAECTDKNKSGETRDETFNGDSRIDCSEEIGAKKALDLPPSDTSNINRVTSYAPPMKCQDSQ